MENKFSLEKWYQDVYGEFFVKCEKEYKDEICNFCGDKINEVGIYERITQKNFNKYTWNFHKKCYNKAINILLRGATK